jgi:hypothetical protein
MVFGVTLEIPLPRVTLEELVVPSMPISKKCPSKRCKQTDMHDWHDKLLLSAMTGAFVMEKMTEEKGEDGWERWNQVRTYIMRGLGSQSPHIAFGRGLETSGKDVTSLTGARPLI